MQTEIFKYLEALRDRQINFREFKKILRSNDMPVSNGWDGLIPKYKALSGDVDIDAYLKVLKSVYKNHYLYANRAIVVLKFEQGQVAKIAPHLQEWIDPDSGFRSSFPIPVDQQQLRFLSSNPVYTRVLSSKSEPANRTLVSCSKRYVRSREVIDYSEFSPEARDTLAGYDEVIGVRSRFVQAFDTLMFRPGEDLVILTIDLCGNLSLQDIGRSIIIHLDMLNEKLGDVGFDIDSQDLRINFFPKIDILYHRDDGLVERIGHVTTSGSNKIERMRNKNKDLRKEPFHHSGLKALNGATDLFLIGKRWNVDDYQIGVTIPGTHAQAGNPDAVIQAAIFDGCRNQQDFRKVLDHLIK